MQNSKPKLMQLMQPELPYPRKPKLMQVSNNVPVPVGRLGNACDAILLIY